MPSESVSVLGQQFFIDFHLMLSSLSVLSPFHMLALSLFLQTYSTSLLFDMQIDDTDSDDSNETDTSDERIVSVKLKLKEQGKALKKMQREIAEKKRMLKGVSLPK